MSGINLVKGQKISLAKPDGGALSKVFMGLGWDASRGGRSIDLDASCVMLDANKSVLDTVSFRQLRSRDGSIQHSGDNLTGAGDGDDEVINLDLSKVPANVQHIVFTINSFQGQTFDNVQNCYARFVDKDTNNELCKYQLAEQGNHNAKVMCKVYRHDGGWKFAALGLVANGRTVSDIISDVLSVI